MAINPANSRSFDSDPRRRGPLVYALCLFVTALLLLSYLVARRGILAGDYSWPSASFFFVFSLFTISMGYQRPGFGYVSFDRVAQIAAILVLGPVDAAWINGLASMIYPWHRIWRRISVKEVATASLHNAGLMTLMILSCGTLYEVLGGPIPLTYIDIRSAGLLLLLTLSMQGMNDGSMAVLMYLYRKNTTAMLNLFSIAVEFASVPLAILVAIVFVRLELSVTVLLLFVMSLGMLVLKKFAQMRIELEALVDVRTEELRLKSLELEQQATHDKLTGLFNRRYADNYLQNAIDNAKRRDHPFAIALADIDHFKQVNDNHSHAVGDRVLQKVAEIFANRCRKTDIVARYGGEEFLFCFPDTDPEFAEQICSQIRTTVECTDWSEIGEDINITVSFGVAVVDGDSRRTGILSDADLRLYQAKNKGRNQVVGLRRSTGTD